MIYKNKLNSVLRVFVGLVFLFSAISKLISIDSFEIYVYSFGILKLYLASFLTRFIISFELFIGIMLVTGKNTKITIFASIIMLTVFSAFILFLFVTRNNEQCHCFGEIEISHGSSLLKNILLIALLVLAYRSHGNKRRFDKLIIVSSFILSLSLPFIVSPPDSLFYNWYSKSVTYNDAMLADYLKENNQFTYGKKMLCFLSTGCSFCKLAARKITVIAKKTNDTDVVNYIFAGSQVSVDKFFRETNSTAFQYTFLPPTRFLKITNGEMPLIILLEDGKVKGKYGYRDINEYEIIRFLKNQ
jgi:uncharacterized membrane protein YphA (DoxX/SURF4 family)